MQCHALGSLLPGGWQSQLSAELVPRLCFCSMVGSSAREAPAVVGLQAGFCMCSGLTQHRISTTACYCLLMPPHMAQVLTKIQEQLAAQYPEAAQRVFARSRAVQPAAAMQSAAVREPAQPAAAMQSAAAVQSAAVREPASAAAGVAC